MAKRKQAKTKPKERYARICPKCKSDDVSHDWSNPATVDSGLVNVIYRCNNCGHAGMVFPEVPESEVPKTPTPLKHVKERTLVDTTYGQGEVGILGIMGPLLIVSSLLSFLFGTEPFKIPALFFLLPSGIIFTFLPHGRRLIEENKLVRILCFAMMVYTLFGPLFWLAGYFYSGTP